MPARFGNRRRQSLRDVFQGIVKRANEWPADALLIAGDLFEHERVTRDTVAFLHSLFESLAPIPVVIAPGNHDPFVPDSPYATELWPDNVFIFREPDWQAIPLAEGRLIVHGFAFDGPDISKNPFGTLTIPSSEKNVVHVALAHGSERGHHPPDKTEYAPFDGTAAAVKGLHYLALGHFHSVTPIEGPFSTIMYYSGAPEGHGFNAPGERHYLEVEITADGRENHAENGVIVTPVRSSRVQYITTSLDCASFESTQDVVEAVRRIAKDADTSLVARIDLTGKTGLSLQSEIPALRDAVARDFEYVELNDKTEGEDDYPALASQETSLGVFVRALNTEIDDATDPARRQLLERAREVGVAAYRHRPISIRGLDREENPVLP